MKTFVITNTILFLCLLPDLSWAQLYSITGYIQDSCSGKALENVSIFEENSGIGTITNQKGFYRLVLHSRNADLTISYHGFKDCSKVFKMHTDTTLMVKLEPRIEQHKSPKKDIVFQVDNSSVKKKNDRHDQEYK